jgi:hypothetical protein
MLREVPLTQLKNTLFGRAALNELDTEHVAYLTTLIKGGLVLPPISITPDNEIIDGRHRVQCYQDLGYEAIPCEVIAGKSRVEYQGMALTANTGCAKPPVRADLTFVLTQLQKDGATDAAIYAVLCPAYPKRVIKEQLDWNRSNERLMKFRAAMKLRNEEDLTLKETAERTRLPEAELKEFIRSGGKRRKQESKFGGLHKNFQMANKSYGEQTKYLFPRTFEAFNNGQLTEAQVLELLHMPGEYGRLLVRRSDDAIKRFMADVAAHKQVAG